MPIDIDTLYKRWVDKLGEKRINLKYPSLRGLHDWFLRECERRAIDPESIDFEALVDPTLTYKENQMILGEEMTSPLTESEAEAMSREILAQMEKEVREKYPDVVEPFMERISELEREKDKRKRLQKVLKELRFELEETKGRLEELMKRPPPERLVKLRALKPIEFGIWRYRVGQEFETADVDWAKRMIGEGFAVEVPLVPAIAPPPPVPLIPPKKEARVKVRVEGQREKGEYVARMLFDGFEAGFIGFRTTESLESWLKRGEDVVDWRENLRAAGLSPEEIGEELATFPEPFREGVPVKVLWKHPEDVSFDFAAESYWNIAHAVYSRPMLEAKSVEELKNIAKIRGLRVPETKEELINVILGVRLPPPVLFPPPKPRELTTEEKKRLEDEFRVVLIHELGRVPRDSMAEFRLELDTVKMLPFDQALKVIRGLAEEIVEREKAPPVRIVRRPPPRVPLEIPYAVPPEEAVPPPALMPLPDQPLCPELEFPRAPCSREKTWLLDAFKNRMEREGVDVRRFVEAFREQIWNMVFRSWNEVIERFNFLVDTIVKYGKAEFFIKRPAMPWGTPEEQKEPATFLLTPTQRRDAIIHLLSLASREGPLKQRTWEEFLDFAKEQGVFEVTREEARRVAKEAWEKREVWFLNIPKEQLDAILGEDWIG